MHARHNVREQANLDSTKYMPCLPEGKDGETDNGRRLGHEKTRTRDLGLYYTTDNKDKKDSLVEPNCYTS